MPARMVTEEAASSSETACEMACSDAAAAVRWVTKTGGFVPFGRSIDPTSPGIVQHRDARPGVRGVHRLLEHPRQLRRARHGVPVAGDVAEEQVVVDLLEEVAAHLGGGHLAADREHRSVRLRCVVQAVEQVDRAGSDGAHADPEGAGQLRLRGGGERTGLLVTDADPAHAVLAADRVRDRVQGVADDAPDLPHAEVVQAVDQHLRDGGHGRAPQKWSGSAMAQSRAQLSGGSRSSCPGSSHSNSSAYDFVVTWSMRRMSIDGCSCEG